jgi:hypothetical protein
MAEQPMREGLRPTVYPKKSSENVHNAHNSRISVWKRLCTVHFHIGSENVFGDMQYLEVPKEEYAEFEFRKIGIPKLFLEYA